jgi:hypothetical protein
MSMCLLDEAKSMGVMPEAVVLRDAVDGSDLTQLDLRNSQALWIGVSCDLLIIS